MTHPVNRRVVIIVKRDLYANSVKPRYLKDFLTSHGYRVDECESVGLGRHFQSFGFPVPNLSRPTIILYFYELMWLLVRNALRMSNTGAMRAIQGHLLNRIIPLRGSIMAGQLSTGNYYAVICESLLDQAVFLGRRIADVQILDLPVPWVDELYYGAQLTEKTRDKLADLQRDCYAAADRISFHWHTYTEYVKQGPYHGNNWLNCTYGVTTKNKRARFAFPPRIIFLGSLEGYWVNLPLLRKLCRICPELDVWGGPEPGADAGLNYRGYAPDLDIMADYQFGLVTITDDPLRRSSFSSKHLEYASYGLPVLTPSWRSDEVLGPSSIYYGPEDFLEVLAEHSSEAAWTAKSKESLAVAEELSWPAAFRSLAEVLDLRRPHQ